MRGADLEWELEHLRHELEELERTQRERRIEVSSELLRQLVEMYDNPSLGVIVDPG